MFFSNSEVEGCYEENGAWLEYKKVYETSLPREPEPLDGLRQHVIYENFDWTKADLPECVPNHVKHLYE